MVVDVVVADVVVVVDVVVVDVVVVVVAALVVVGGVADAHRSAWPRTFARLKVEQAIN